MGLNRKDGLGRQKSITLLDLGDTQSFQKALIKEGALNQHRDSNLWFMVEGVFLNQGLLEARGGCLKSQILLATHVPPQMIALVVYFFFRSSKAHQDLPSRTVLGNTGSFDIYFLIGYCA